MEQGNLEVKFPSLGASFSDEIRVISLFVSIGDRVTKDQILVEVESDKASVGLPAPAPGVVKELHIKLGDRVESEQLILVLNETQEISATANANFLKEDQEATSETWEAGATTSIGSQNVQPTSGTLFKPLLGSILLLGGAIVGGKLGFDLVRNSFGLSTIWLLLGVPTGAGLGFLIAIFLSAILDLFETESSEQEKKTQEAEAERRRKQQDEEEAQRRRATEFQIQREREEEAQREKKREEEEHKRRDAEDRKLRRIEEERQAEEKRTREEEYSRKNLENNYLDYVADILEPFKEYSNKQSAYLHGCVDDGYLTERDASFINQKIDDEISLLRRELYAAKDRLVEQAQMPQEHFADKVAKLNKLPRFHQRLIEDIRRINDLGIPNPGERLRRKLNAEEEYNLTCSTLYITHQSLYSQLREDDELVSRRRSRGGDEYYGG